MSKEDQITLTSEVLRQTVGQILEKTDPAAYKKVNPAWQGFAKRIVATRMVENIFVDEGVVKERKTVDYFFKRIYGGNFNPDQVYPEKDELGEVLKLGSAEIENFQAKLSEEVEKLSKGELWPNGSRR